MSILSRFKARALFAVFLVLGLGTMQFVRIHAANGPSPNPVRLRSGDRYLTPTEGESFLKSAAGTRGGIIQFETLPTESQRASLAALGVELQTYLPENAFIASIPSGVTTKQLESNGIKWAGAFTVEDKLAEALQVYGATPEWCVGSDGLPRFSIGLFKHLDLQDAEQWMAAEFGANIIGTSKLGHAIEVSLPADNWQVIASDDRVLWIEPFWPRVAHNNSNRTNVRADVAQTAPYSLLGTNVAVGEWDGGRADPAHPDFGGRVISMDASAIHPHSTHVAGTVMGAGASPLFTYRGMAPNAYLLTHEWFFSGSEMETEYQYAIENFSMHIATNSWGVGYSPPTVSNCNAFLGNYFAECGNLDDAARGDLGSPVTIVWSAGNERGGGSQYCSQAGFSWGTVTPYGTAKNVITIGAIYSNTSSMTDFSSWGPTDDGRLKPELVGPGCQQGADAANPDIFGSGVTSTKPTSGYTVMCGTSMAAPTMTGCVALWTERWNSEPRDPAFASTVKAVFVESADDLGDPGPEYDFGYGRIDVVEAIDLLDQGRFIQDSISHGETRTWTFDNPGTIPMVSVTLAWDDPAAAENASVTLINNLNLRLIPPSGPAEYLPWSLNPASPASSATTGINVRDNLEQVRRTSGIQTGTWTVEVTGANVPVGPQRFSLAFAAGMSLTSTNQAYAVSIQAAGNPSSPMGVAALPFTLSNNGLNNDTYDVTLTSSHGWAIASNPRTLAVDANSDSSLTFDLTIPPGTPYGTIDTISALAESQNAPPLTSSGVMYVTVISGRDVSVTAANDTLGVPGRTISITTRLSNTGAFDDTLLWSVSDDAFWSIVPASGSTPIPFGGYADIVVAVTIPGAATPSIVNSIYFEAESEDDAAANAFGQTDVSVLAHPPLAVLALPADNAVTNNTAPMLNWTHGAYTPPPPGFSDFSYYVDIEEYPIPVSPIRHGPVTDTFFTLPAMSDGQYQWRVTTINPVGDTASPSAPRKFNIDTQAPNAPALVAPADNLYEADTTLTFTWNTVLDAAQYKWEMATDAGFTAGLDSTLTAVPTHDRIYASCSTVVYWRVRAIDAAGNISTPSVANRYAVYKVGDINFDCYLDIVDVVGMVSVAFRNGALPVPPGRAEMLCNPPTDITDVVRLIEVVFRNGAPPCGPQ